MANLPFPIPIFPMSDAQQQLQEEFDRFVEFGTLLDRSTRRYLAQYLHTKIDPKAPEPEDEIDDTYYRYFKKALDRVFEGSDLIDLVRDKPQLSQQIASDTLFWLRKAHERIQEKNPYDDERRRLAAAEVMPLRDVVNRWYHLTNYLQNQYEREQIDGSFYAKKFEDIIGKQSYEEMGEGSKKELDRIFTDMLSQWDALYQAKLLEFQLQKLEEEQEQFKDLVEQKVDEYQKLSGLLSPFAEYVGRYWDMSRELWEDSDFDILQKYHDLLENEDSIRELADLLGRMREAEIISEEETYEEVVVRKHWEENDSNKAEITGVYESDDLNALLPAETALLGDDHTETLFLKKYADKGLQTFRYQDKHLVVSEDQFTRVTQRVKQKEKGPFIVCVDTSDSMSGRAENIAKVLCFAILKLAARENRRAYLINFSTGIQTVDLYDVGNSLDDIAAFLRMSFHGGTDISLALYEVLRQLQTESYRDADVLVVSDFIMYRIEDDIMQRIKFHQQNNGTHFHSLTLHEDPNAEVIEQFDTNWIYDPEQKGIVRELSGALRSISGQP
jgi:uncharacterized protein with von Willebrand factor type A (vWA) domain